MSEVLKMGVLLRSEVLVPLGYGPGIENVT